MPLPRQAPPARRDSPRCPLTRINPSRPPTVVWRPASWDDVVPPLVASNLIREADYPMLEAMVGFVCRARQARDMLNDQPLMLRGREEGDGRHPLSASKRDSWASAQKIAALFGMTPADRTRLGLQQMKGMSLAQELEAKLDGISDDVPEEIEIRDGMVEVITNCLRH